MTTNGPQLHRFADELADWAASGASTGLDGTPSDPPTKFRAITRWGDLARVMAGIEAAERAGLKIKINARGAEGASTIAELPRMLEWAHGRGMDLTVIETRPMGEIDADRTGPVSAALPASRRSGASLHPDRHSLQDRRAGALRGRRRDRRAARLHHADDPQFLRELQPGATHLHRHALHVSRSGRTRPICGMRCRRPRKASELLSLRPSTRRSGRKPQGP